MMPRGGGLARPRSEGLANRSRGKRGTIVPMCRAPKRSPEPSLCLAMACSPQSHIATLHTSSLQSRIAFSSLARGRIVRPRSLESLPYALEMLIAQVEEEEREAQADPNLEQEARREEEGQEHEELQSLDQGRLVCTARVPLQLLSPDATTAVADFLATYVAPHDESWDCWDCTECGDKLAWTCDRCKQKHSCCDECDYYLRLDYLRWTGDGEVGYFFCWPCTRQWYESRTVVDAAR